MAAFTSLAPLLKGLQGFMKLLAMGGIGNGDVRLGVRRWPWLRGGWECVSDDKSCSGG